MLSPSGVSARVLRLALVTGLSVLAATGASAAPSDDTFFDSTPPAAPAAPPVDAFSRFLIERKLLDTGHGEAVHWRQKAGDMVLTAMNFLGVRYQRGGTTADGGFDCSGFTRLVFESSLGLVLPRRADDQAKAAGLIDVARAELRPGDLVFFNTLRRTFSHVGIYVGEGKFVHAPRPGGEVRVEDMRLVYWAKRFTGARRAEPLAEVAAVEATDAPPAAANPSRRKLPVTPALR